MNPIVLLFKILRRLKNIISILFFIAKVSFFFFINKAKKKKHNLNSELVVSLTSYPARYKTLHLTLKSILMQTVQVDKFILWVANDDFATLPKKVLALQKHGLLIKQTEDIKSYKKIIPALEIYPNASIVALDDDLYYPSVLIEKLVEKAMSYPDAVIASRTHIVQFDEHGQIKPYMQWDWSQLDEKNVNSFVTSGAGTLFPPNSLYCDTNKTEIFMDLAPNADDIWLNWMIRLNKTKVIHSGYQYKLVSWPNSQKTALCLTNTVEHELNNDAQIKRMIDYYGLPFTNKTK